MFKGIDPYNKSVILFVSVLGVIMLSLFLVGRLTEPKFELQLQNGSLKIEGSKNIQDFLQKIDKVEDFNKLNN